LTSRGGNGHKIEIQTNLKYANGGNIWKEYMCDDKSACKIDMEKIMAVPYSLFNG